MTILTADQIHFDDFDPLLTDDPALVYKQYDELRSRCPVARTSKYNGYWSLLNYADVKKAANSSDLFISSVKAVVPSDPKGIRRPPLNTDGDVHTPYRRALDRTLKPARLKRLQERLAFHAEAEFTKLVNRGGGDVCCDFGSLYVAKVETEWLNLEATQGDLLAQTASKWVAAWRDLDAANVSFYSGIMYGIARDVIADRRSNPRDAEEDPASSLLEEIGPNGEPLDEEQLVGAIRQSLVVGTVAPPIIFGSIVRHLSHHRDLQKQLRSDPSLLPAATEEFIRLFSPYRGFSRTVARPVELHGRLIRPSEPVCLTYAAANRDPSVFDDPNEFRMHRHNISSHLGFGSGRHRCAGMPLARLVIQTALATILSLTSDFEVVEEKMAYAAMPELGAITCPIKITPA